MIYTPLTIHAMQFMFSHMVKENDSSDYRYDKGGVAYVFHPWHVAESMNDEVTTAAALLHDVVEDTDVTLQDLRDEGFPESVVSAVELLSHPSGVSYMDYVKRLAPNDAARAVKLSDLAHNMTKERLPLEKQNTADEKKRLQKYQQARDYLLSFEEKGAILLKRAYAERQEKDGTRILVDRLWPRGIKKEEAGIDAWEKDIAPTNELRKQFHQGSIDFSQFEKKYLEELDANPAASVFSEHVKKLKKSGNVTLVFSAKDTEKNNAVVLRKWLLK